MIFPFMCTLGGHWRVIHWPRFNIVVSQEIRRPREGEGGWEWQTSRGIKTHTTLIWVCSVELQDNDNGNIRDPGSPITITNKVIRGKFEMWQEFPKCDAERQSKCGWKNSTYRLA